MESENGDNRYKLVNTKDSDKLLTKSDNWS